MSPIWKIIEILCEFSEIIMKGLYLDRTPALSRNLPPGKNTGKPYVKQAVKGEWLLKEKRAHLKIKRKQEEEQTLLREKKKISFKKLLLKFRKGKL